MNGKLKVKIIIGIIVAVIAVLLIIDKIPFSQKIDQTISADIYKDGAVIGVLNRGEKHCIIRGLIEVIFSPDLGI